MIQLQSRAVMILFALSMGCQGAEDQPSSPDSPQPEDMARDAQRDTSSPLDMREIGGPDQAPPMIEDMGKATPDQGGVKLGTPAPIGPPPELNPEHPLHELPKVERLLPETLIQSIDNIQWQHQSRRLQFSLCKGGRGSVEKLSNEDYDADKSKQEHPYSMWSYQDFTEGAKAWESMRLPAQPNGRGETHWCKEALSLWQTWCNHNYAKSQERILRVTMGDGLNAPLVYDRWDLPNQHVNAYDFAETSDGVMYWVLKQGIINAKSRMMMLKPKELMTPMGGGVGPDKMVRVSDECVTDSAGARVCVPSEDIVEVALSPDEETIYFTTGGYHTEGGFGALWSAPIMEDGTLGAQTILVGDVPRARGMTIDDAGNLYVASGLEVRVYSPAGVELGVINIVEDATHKEELLKGKKEFTALSVAFGGPHFNVLYIGIGYDRKGTENIDQPTNHTLGGLFRVPLRSRGAWAKRHNISPPN